MNRTIDALYENETLHLLTPLKGLKDQTRVRIKVLGIADDDVTAQGQGLAGLKGGWEGSEALAESVEKICHSRSRSRSLPRL